VFTAFVGIGFSSAASASPSARLTTAHRAAERSRPNAPIPGEPSCPLNGNLYTWCIWTGTGGTGSVIDAGISIPNLGVAGYRNVDESVENDGSSPPPGVTLFLYYSPNYQGAWLCLPGGYYVANASTWHFNQGKGLAGYDQSIWHNVASVKFVGDFDACLSVIAPPSTAGRHV
jgi:hypothetical protein